MPADETNNVRARDDSRLRRQIADARAGLEAAGQPEQALDWDAVVRQERALWWREHLTRSLAALGRRAGQFAGETAEAIRELALAPQTLAAAAFEVTLDAARELGRVEPAGACIAEGVNLEFGYGSAAERRERGIADRDEQAIAVFMTAEIRGGRVVVDARAHTLAVEFLPGVAPPLVMLVPEDPDQVAVMPELDIGASRALFREVENGEYLLFVRPVGGR